MLHQRKSRKVLRGEKPDHVPFTAYENKTLPGEAERWLRNNGMCVVYRMGSVGGGNSNVKEKFSEFDENRYS